MPATNRPREMNLAFFAFPGCIVAANTLRQVSGDYETVARITYSGVIRYDVPDLRPEYRDRINAMAAREQADFRQRYLADCASGDYGRRRRVEEIYDRLPHSDFLRALGSLWDLPPEDLYARFMALETASWRGELPRT